MSQRLDLLAEHAEGRTLLRSPEVGFFTRALPAGALLGPRSAAGVLHSLGRRIELVTPAGVAGRVVNAQPERVLAPVGYGTVLYELAPLEGGAGHAPEVEPAEDSARGALLFRAPYSGRFWQRPAPNDPPFLRAGELLVEGRALGLLEVMKTFTQLVYRSEGHAGGKLPPRARFVRFLVPDGGEVEDGGALLELAQE